MREVGSVPLLQILALEVRVVRVVGHADHVSVSSLFIESFLNLGHDRILVISKLDGVGQRLRWVELALSYRWQHLVWSQLLSVSVKLLVQ